VGGLGFSADGTLYACSRRGEIWAHRPASGSSPARWWRFAAGLHEPLGLLVLGNGDLAVAQRPEVSRVRDTDGDGRADRVETITAAFGVSGNYHEYNYGPVRDSQGNLYGTLNLGWDARGTSTVPYRGWAYKITPQGRFVPFALGLRSPAGLAVSPGDELFVTDNQGDFMPASPLFHVEAGQFYGHPASLRWEAGYKGPEDAAELPVERFAGRRRLPAIWFVYGKLGHSPTEPTWDRTGGRFGPFAGQMLVGDQTKSLVTRVALEKVGGRYQGAVFPFRRGFGSGITRLAWDRSGRLWVGGTDRGWGAIGGRPFALETLSWTGKLPFEIKTMTLTRDGFELRFTKKVAPGGAAARPSSYALSHFGYHYWKTYGSPHVGVTPVPVKEAKVAPDGLSVRLVLPALVKERVYELVAKGLEAEDGAPLLHEEAFYTLNATRAEGEGP
jgi:hypothetical protein